jgi:hypothetical protein
MDSGRLNPKVSQWTLLAAAITITLILTYNQPNKNPSNSIFITTDDAMNCTARIYEDGLLKSERNMAQQMTPPGFGHYAIRYEYLGGSKYYHQLKDLNLTTEDFEIRIICVTPGYRGVAYTIINNTNIQEYALPVS